MLSWLKRRPKAEREVKKALGDFELPTFPAVVNKAMAMLRNPETPLGDVGDVLVSDPGVSAKLLNVANSTSYALRHPVKSVGHAVSLLGRSEVEGLLLGVAVSKALPKRAPGINGTLFWTAACRRASLAGVIARETAPRARSEVFTAALLQDMALPLLASSVGDRYVPLLDAWRGGDGSLAELERDAFGWDHAVVAGWMSERWKFPGGLVDALGAHHDEGSQGDARQILSLVSVIGEGEVDHERGQIIDLVQARYGIPPEKAEAWATAGFEDADELRRLLAA